jgi:hypothetical protein
MTTSAPWGVAELLDELAEIATGLDASGASAEIDALRNHRHAAKLQLLVLGSTGSGRSTLVNVLLGSQLLPVSPVPRPPVSIRLSRGEATSAVRAGRDGSRMAVESSRLYDVLPSLDQNRDLALDIAVASPVLETCDIQIGAVEARRTQPEWRELLEGTDFVFFLIRADAPLSDAEKRLVRDHLAGEFGLERVALLISKVDLIEAAERNSIADLVQTFLGPLESQPALALVSLAGGDTTDSDRGVVRTLAQDVLSRRATLRADSLRRSLQTVISSLEDTARRLKGVYAMDESQVGAALEEISGRRDWLQARVARAQRRVDAFVMTVAKEQLLRRVETFAGSFSAGLPAEIESIENVALIRRHLPAYIERVWTDFMAREAPAVQARLTQEVAEIEDLIESDLRELLAGSGAAAIDLPAPEGSDLHVFVMPSRGKHRAASMARSLSFQGFLFLLLPWFSTPMGLLSLAAGQVLDRVFKHEIDAGNRKAMVGPALKASQEVERQVRRLIDQQFSETSEHLRTDIAAVYEEAVAGIVEALEHRKAERQDFSRRGEQIDAMLQVRLPALRGVVEGV